MAGRGDQPSLARVMTGLMPVSLAVQVASFASSIALARVLGASVATDAYFIGLSVPVLVYAILLSAVRAGATPSLTAAALSRDDPSALDDASSTLVSATLAASAVLSVVVFSLAAAVLPLVVGGEGDLTSLARRSALELAPLGVTGAVTGALGAILAVRGVFAPQVAAMAVEPVLKTALTFAFGRDIGTHALIIGNDVGSAAAALLLFAYVRRVGVRVRVGRRLDVSFVRAVFALSAPLLISQSVLQVNPVVDRTMASGLGAGSVTSLELGLRLFVVPTALLSATLVAPVTARWARAMETEGWEALQRSLTGMLTAATWILPPAMVLGIVLREPLVRTIYAGGAYSDHAIHETTAVVAMLILSLPAQMLTIGFSTVFLVHRETLFPMKVGVANALLNIALNFALRPVLGVAGIALSTSLTLTILLAAYAVAVRRRFGPFYLASVRGAVVAVTGAVAASAAAAIGLTLLLPDASTRPRALLTLVVVSAAVVVVHAAVMRTLRFVAPVSSAGGIA